MRLNSSKAWWIIPPGSQPGCRCSAGQTEVRVEKHVVMLVGLFLEFNYVKSQQIATFILPDLFL